MTRDRLHVEVAGLTDALRAVAAARTLGVSITLLSPPAAAAYGGCAWFRRLAERVRRPDDDVDWVLDCGERAGDALTAIADGCPAVVFSGTTAALARLEDAAAGRGARVSPRRPTALKLRPGGDPAAACRDWLSRND